MGTPFNGIGESSGPSEWSTPKGKGKAPRGDKSGKVSDVAQDALSSMPVSSAAAHPRQPPEEVVQEVEENYKNFKRCFSRSRMMDSLKKEEDICVSMLISFLRDGGFDCHPLSDIHYPTLLGQQDCQLELVRLAKSQGWSQGGKIGTGSHSKWTKAGCADLSIPKSPAKGTTRSILKKIGNFNKYEIKDKFGKSFILEYGVDDTINRDQLIALLETFGMSDLLTPEPREAEQMVIRERRKKPKKSSEEEEEEIAVAVPQPLVAQTTPKEPKDLVTTFMDFFTEYQKIDEKSKRFPNIAIPLIESTVESMQKMEIPSTLQPCYHFIMALGCMLKMVNQPGTISQSHFDQADFFLSTIHLSRFDREIMSDKEKDVYRLFFKNIEMFAIVIDKVNAVEWAKHISPSGRNRRFIECVERIRDKETCFESLHEEVERFCQMGYLYLFKVINNVLIHNSNLIKKKRRPFNEKVMDSQVYFLEWARQHSYFDTVPELFFKFHQLVYIHRIDNGTIPKDKEKAYFQQYFTYFKDCDEEDAIEISASITNGIMENLKKGELIVVFDVMNHVFETALKTELPFDRAEILWGSWGDRRDSENETFHLEHMINQRKYKISSQLITDKEEYEKLAKRIEIFQGFLNNSEFRALFNEERFSSLVQIVVKIQKELASLKKLHDPETKIDANLLEKLKLFTLKLSLKNRWQNIGDEKKIALLRYLLLLKDLRDIYRDFSRELSPQFKAGTRNYLTFERFYDQLLEKINQAEEIAKSLEWESSIHDTMTGEKQMQALLTSMILWNAKFKKSPKSANKSLSPLLKRILSAVKKFELDILSDEKERSTFAYELEKIMSQIENKDSLEALKAFLGST